MADMTPVPLKLTIGSYTVSNGSEIAADSLSLLLTISPTSWRGSPSTALLPPVSLRLSIGRYRSIDHTGPATAENPVHYNGTTYEVLMTGEHAGLPDITIPATAIDAEEGAVKVDEMIVIPTPEGRPSGTSLGGVLGSTDYGTDRAQVGDTSAAQGAQIDSVALVDDATGNAYSTAYYGGSQKIFRHKIDGASQKLIAIYPFVGPKILQLRSVPGEGFIAATNGGFYVIGDPATPNTHHARNSGMSSSGGGRLSCLADGSLIVYSPTDMQVWKSTDLGLHWTSVQGNLVVIGQRPRDVFVATATHWYLVTTAGLWKTTNAGVLWTLANGNLEATLGTFRGDSGMFSVTSSASAPNTVTIGLQGHVARSTNGGSTWTIFGPAQGLGIKPVRYRVHQVGSVIFAAYGEFYEARPNGYVWRSEDNGASWQVAFPGPSAPCVNDFSTAVGFSSDLALAATPKAAPDVVDKPWVPTDIGHRVGINRSSLVSVTAQVDSALLAAINARTGTVDGKKARLIVRQIKDYRTQRYTQTIASGRYLSMTREVSSLGGLTIIILTAKDTEVFQSRALNAVARVIPQDGVVVGLESEGSDITLSLVIDETFAPYTKISWQGTDYIVSGIKYLIGDGARLMSLNTGVRVFSVPTSTARAGVTKEFPRYASPRVTAQRSRLLGGSRGSGGRSSAG